MWAHFSIHNNWITTHTSKRQSWQSSEVQTTSDKPFPLCTKVQIEEKPF
jgi:hypothetical protein